MLTGATIGRVSAGGASWGGGGAGAGAPTRRHRGARASPLHRFRPRRRLRRRSGRGGASPARRMDLRGGRVLRDARARAPLARRGGPGLAGDPRSRAQVRPDRLLRSVRLRRGRGGRPGGDPQAPRAAGPRRRLRGGGIGDRGRLRARAPRTRCTGASLHLAPPARARRGLRAAVHGGAQAARRQRRGDARARRTRCVTWRTLRHEGAVVATSARPVALERWRWTLRPRAPYWWWTTSFRSASRSLVCWETWASQSS